MLITPCGRSLVARTSAKVIAESGASVLARTTTVLPEVIIGATQSIKPRSDGVSGAIAATTPMLSGIVKL